MAFVSSLLRFLLAVACQPVRQLYSCKRAWGNEASDTNVSEVRSTGLGEVPSSAQRQTPWRVARLPLLYKPPFSRNKPRTHRLKGCTGCRSVKSAECDNAGDLESVQDRARAHSKGVRAVQGRQFPRSTKPNAQGSKNRSSFATHKTTSVQRRLPEQG